MVVGLRPATSPTSRAVSIPARSTPSIGWTRRQGRLWSPPES